MRAIGKLLLGAALKNRLIDGRGVVGSVAGVLAASKASAKTVWQVSVRFEDGINRWFTVDQQPHCRPGDRVAVSNGVVGPLR